MFRISKGKNIRHIAANRDYPSYPNDDLYDHPDNHEEDDYRDSQGHHNYIANYTKALPHHLTGPEIGEVIPTSYRRLLVAVDTGNPADFNAIPLGVTRKLINPQSGLAFDLESRDSHAFVIPPAPRIDGPEAASEMAELYWMSLSRDISFNDFVTGTSVINNAVADLSNPANYKNYTGPKPVNTSTIFRGTLVGDLVGPYISQFLLLGNDDPSLNRTFIDGYITYGSLSIDQRQKTVQSGIDYLTGYHNTPNSWLDIENGAVASAPPTCGNAFDPSPTPNPPDTRPPSERRGRFIRNMRDLANYVHFDDLPQEFLNACLLLIHMDAPCVSQPHGPASPGNPYKNMNYSNQEGFGTFGDQHIISLIGEVTRRAIYAAWFQKWFVHRRLRPEEFGALIHRQLNATAPNPTPGLIPPTPPYPIHSDILSSGVLLQIFNYNAALNSSLPAPFNIGSYLLPQVFPEGSPTHPSYPQGHATISGACVTVLKAYFDESFVIPNPVKVDPSLDGTPDEGTRLVPISDTLTLGDELNKLASNISLGRDMAGVHYRSDYLQGVLLGEAVAISMLEDQRNTYNEDYFFEFTMFNGKRKRIEKQ